MKNRFIVSLLFLALFFCFWNNEARTYLRVLATDAITNLAAVESTNIPTPQLAETTDQLCPSVTLPYTEDFEPASLKKDCWKVLDVNGDGTASANKWRLYNAGGNFNANSYFFSSINAAATHNDWLISPSFTADQTSIYKVSFYYKAPPNTTNTLEIAVSNQGTDPSKFTTIIAPFATYKNALYKQKTVYITNMQGEVNVGWHIQSTGTASFYIDDIKIEKVDCIGPNENITVSNIQHNQATVTWQDTINTQWEYVVQPFQQGAPNGSGLIATTKQVVLSTVNITQLPLQPDTHYDFYIRAVCSGSKKGDWVGPIRFKTECIAFNAPFWEGFNAGSPSLSCWSTVDNNRDYYTTTVSNTWSTVSTGQYEGNGCMYFSANNVTTAIAPHDDWLITPGFNVVASKRYRLRFHFKTLANNQVDLKVLSSTTGTDIANFKQLLLDKKAFQGSVYEQGVVIFGNHTGVVNFAFHISTPGLTTYCYIDNVFFEEIEDCPEPTNLGVDLVNPTDVTLTWLEPFGQSWEYVLQEKVGIAPKGNGTAATSTNVLVTQDKNGVPLKPNTEYEYYVRTRCDDGSYSTWSGPHVFQTACGIFSPTPFYEHFNVNSTSINCWTILDENKDSTSPTGNGLWRPFAAVDFVGSRAMRIYGAADNVHDDWLISPTLQCKPNAVYRLIYQYKTDSYSASNFEVLASNKGINPADFTKTIVADTYYKTAEYIEHRSFVTGLDGLVNLAWRTKDKGFKFIYIDNITLEEVVNCPEPLILGAKDMEKNQATIFWDIDFGATSWQYYVQLKGQGTPVGTGTLASSNLAIVTQMQNGQALLPNANYEFYVRTVCSDGTYSNWSEPFEFATLCSTYQTPFWEGFNSDSTTARCWSSMSDAAVQYTGATKWVKNAANKYEGDLGMGFSGNSESDNWLVSPELELDGSTYVLKYHYKANAEFEVVASNKGLNPTDFTQVIVASKSYTNTGFIEEVTLLSGLSGKVHLAWHILGNKNSSFAIDNVSIQKVVSCAEPYGLKASNVSTTNAQLNWLQDTGLTSWEVLIVDYKSPSTAQPVQQLTVNGVPEILLTGLASGKSYTAYVRAICTNKTSYSDWSTPIDFGTIVDTNNTCAGAIVLPTNQTSTCETSVSGAFNLVKPSVIGEPSCGSAAVKHDIWFSFIATDKAHVLTIKDWPNLPTIFCALYEVSCPTAPTDAIECFNLTGLMSKRVLKNLTVGQQYYIRMATTNTTLYGLFNLCLTTPDYLQISPSGEDYTVEELITDVLVDSSCDLVSNVTYQNGDGSPAAMAFNTVGSFTKGSTDFPFEKGIILSTNEIQYAYGPAQATSRDFRGDNDHRWTGDKDINDAILAAGGAPNGVQEKRVTQIEFDFIPISSEMEFEYLFASNSYYSDCNSLGCSAGALFAAWLIDLTTGEGQNIARIEGTELPIALNTIMNPLKTGKIQCPASFSEKYWKHYTTAQDDPFSAYIDFVGLTIPMKSDKAQVVPGRKYHIKLAVIDFCSIVAHSSAVLFNAGSFDIGSIDLGADLTIAQQTALCDGDSLVLDSKTISIGELTNDIKWYKDGVLLEGETQSTLTVNTPGRYKVTVNTLEVECRREDEILIEFYPRITSLFPAPAPRQICRYATKEQVINLETIKAEILTEEQQSKYDFTYYADQQDAIDGVKAIDPMYQVTQTQNHTIFIRIEDTQTTCFDIMPLNIEFVMGDLPQTIEDTAVCGVYTFGALGEKEYYYSEPFAQGKRFEEGDQITDIGSHTIYVVKDNGEGCIEQTSYLVTITEQPIVEHIEDVVLECEYYVLPTLSKGSRYYTLPNAEGTELLAGSTLYNSQQVWIHTASENGLCTDQSSFTVHYNECPIPKGISPNGDGFNDSFDLSQHSVSSIKVFNRLGAEVYAFTGDYLNQWHGQNKKGTQLPSGTYFYVLTSYGKSKSGWVEISY